jgi:hypothetical protein
LLALFPCTVGSSKGSKTINKSNIKHFNNLSVIGSFFIFGWRWGLLALIYHLFLLVYSSLPKGCFQSWIRTADDDAAIDFENILIKAAGFNVLMEKVRKIK